MSLLEFLDRLRSQGIELRVRDGRVVCDAPTGALTPELLEEIRGRKDEILSALQAAAAARASSPELAPAARADRETPIPLTASQQRVWLLHRMQAYPSASFTVPSAVRIRGPLDVPSLERSLSEVVRRQEVLRTTFPAPDGLPEQVVADGLAYRLRVVSVASSPEDRREAEATRLAEALCEEGIEIGHEPPFRSLLVSLAPHDHVLVLALHLIACDEWAMATLWKEIEACFAAFSVGEESPLKPLAVQCADVAFWQKKWQAGDEARRQLEHWRAKLSGVPAAYELGEAHPPGSRVRLEAGGGSCRLCLDAELSQALAAVGRACGATLYVTLLSVFQALLCRYTGREDVLVGTSAAPRSQAGVPELIGNFANTLVLRTDLSGNPEFTELIRRTKETVLDAFGNLDVPFERLVEALSPPRGRSGMPFFGCLFALRSERLESVSLRGLEVTPWEVDTPSVEQSLSVYAQEGPAGMELVCYYSPALYHRATIDLLLDRFHAFLKRVAVDARARLWDMPLQSEHAPGAVAHGDAGFLVLPRHAALPVPPGGGSRSVPGGNGRKEARRGLTGAATSGDGERVTRADLEATLLSWWQELIGVANVSVHDDFFQSGGDSLVAARVFARLERKMGYPVPLALLYQAPTVATLADLLCRTGSSQGWSPLVAIRAEGTNPPLFLVHGAEGDVLLYRELANRMGADQPVYGLRDEALRGRRPGPSRIEDLASTYVNAIRSVQPAGPYLLGGYCMGGMIAFEMAQQLTRTGARVALVAMLETYNAKCAGYRARFYHPMFHRLQNLQFHLMNVLSLSSADRRGFLARKIRVEIGRLRVGAEYAAARLRSVWRPSTLEGYRHLRVARDNDAAQEAYEPSAYPGRVTVFRPTRDFLGCEDRAMGWEGVAGGGVEVRTIGAAPRGMLVEPFVRSLARELTDSIGRALRGDG